MNIEEGHIRSSFFYGLERYFSALQSSNCVTKLVFLCPTFWCSMMNWSVIRFDGFKPKSTQCIVVVKSNLPLPVWILNVIVTQRYYSVFSKENSIATLTPINHVGSNWQAAKQLTSQKKNRHSSSSTRLDVQRQLVVLHSSWGDWHLTSLSIASHFR